MCVNYILYGEESATMRKKVRQIAKEVHVALDQISVYDAQQAALKEILEDAGSIPFFEAHKVVHVQNATFLCAKDTTGYDLEPLLAYVRDPLPSTTLILSCSCAKLDQRKKAVKELLRSCQSIVCSRISEQDKEAVIRSLLKEHSVEIDAQALSLLVRRMPLDVAIIEEEIEKLALYGGRITSAVIRDLTVRSLDDNVFDLADALLKQRTRDAFRLWRDLDAQQMDPIYLIATLASQFRFLFQVRTLMNEGMSKQGIQSRLQAHPYRIQMSMRQCQPYSSAFLLEQLRQLADLDQRIKSGRIDKKLGFELYLLQGQK